MVVSSSSLTGGLDANKKNEILSAQSRDIRSSRNLGRSIEVKLQCKPLTRSTLDGVLIGSRFTRQLHINYFLPSAARDLNILTICPIGNIDLSLH